MRRLGGIALVLSSVGIVVCVVGCGVPKDQWKNRMSLTMPLAICEADYFEDCFDWTAKECREAIRPFVESCTEDVQDELPDHLNPITGAQWGEKIGRCAGEQVAEANIERFTLTQTCEDTVVKTVGKDALAQIREELESRDAAK